MIYDLTKDEKEVRGFSTATMEHLLVQYGYSAYETRGYRAFLCKDEMTAPAANRLLGETKNGDDYVDKFALNPEVRDAWVLSTLGRHRMTGDQMAKIIEGRPSLIKNPDNFKEVVKLLPEAMRKSPKLFGAMMRHVETQPEDSRKESLAHLIEYTGHTMDAEQIDKVLDFKGRHKIPGTVEPLVASPDIQPRHLDKILAPGDEETYGKPARIFRNHVPLNSGQLRALIEQGRGWPGMSIAKSFSPEHLHSYVNHPSTKTHDAMDTMATAGVYGHHLPTPEVTDFIHKAAEQLPASSGSVGDFIVEAAKHDPKVLDNLKPEVLRDYVGGGAMPGFTAQERVQQLYRALGGDAYEEVEDNPENMKRLHKVTQALGPRATSAFGSNWNRMMTSPNLSDAEKQSVGRHYAQKFWRDYEESVEPQHFAVAKKWQQGSADPVEVVDHRGNHGSSEGYPGVEKYLDQHAGEVRQKLMADKSLPIKDINGRPHVLVYRGVAGNYAHKIIQALGEPTDGVSIPTSSFSSWSTDPREARGFAQRSIPGHENAGVVLRRWAPVHTVIHSGYHPLEAGHKGAHEEERELVFDHRNEPSLSIPREDIHVKRASPEDFDKVLDAAGGKHVPDHVTTHNSHATQGLKKSEKNYTHVPLDENDEWNNISSNLRKLPTEV